jgi:hypothetical protein
MKYEVSIQHLEQPATYPYSEPDLPSPCLLSHFLETHFNIILHSMSGSLQVVSSQVFLPKPCMHTSFPPYVFHIPLLILLDLFTQLTFSEDKDHKVPYYVDLVHAPLNCLQTRNSYKREFCLLGLWWLYGSEERDVAYCS